MTVSLEGEKTALYPINKNTFGLFSLTKDIQDGTVTLLGPSFHLANISSRL